MTIDKTANGSFFLQTKSADRSQRFACSVYFVDDELLELVPR